MLPYAVRALLHLGHRLLPSSVSSLLQRRQSSIPTSLDGYHGMGPQHCPSGKQLFDQCQLLGESRLWLVLWPNFQGLSLTCFNSLIAIKSIFIWPAKPAKEHAILQRSMNQVWSTYPLYWGWRTPKIAGVLSASFSVCRVYPCIQPPSLMETLAILSLPILVIAFSITMSSQHMHFRITI